VKTVILCGGMGTRIRDVADVPKPMIAIGDRPIIWHIMNIYAKYGLDDFVLCLGYKGWTIKEYFLNYWAAGGDITLQLAERSVVEVHDDPAEKWTITLAETGLETQTGGRLRQVRRHLAGEDIFCLTYGDGLADIDISKLIEYHHKHGRIATVTAVRPVGRFGTLQARTLDDLVEVTDFEEKPQSATGWISGGFFVFDRRVWDYIDDRDDLVLEREPLERLAADGQLMAYEHPGFWQPMDTYREWQLLNRLWEADEAPWKTW
jgi:glucose-1-phosphate cytidylyltransferase